jgi:hypothetical protein
MTSVTSEGFQGNPSVVLTSTSGNGYNRFQFTTVSNQIYIASFYIRRLTGSGGIKFINWDSATTPNVPDISSQVSSEWSIATVTFLGRSGGGNVSFGVRCVTSGDSVEIAMPQVEEGTTPSSFLANTTGSPKFITGPTFGPRVPMILVEPSSVNLVTYSEDFSHSSWTKTAATMEGGHTAPDGTATAYKLIEDNTDSVHRTFQTATASVSPSASISVFVKYSGRRYVLIRFADQSVGRWYDLISGTLGGTYLGTPNDSSIELIGNDWYRITLSHTSDAQARCEFWVSDTESVSSYTGDGTSGVYIWGAQLETGIATSYIPTSGSTATRAKDDLVISGSAFSDFFNASEGTTYMEAVPNSSGVYFWSINDGGVANRIFSFYDISDNINHYVISGSTTYFVDDIPASAPSAISRSAISYKTNNVIHSVNGTNSSTDTSVTLPSGLNKLSLGQSVLSQSTLNGHIKRLIYWPLHSDSL